MDLYPVNLNIKDKICVIFGGGEVATRKAKELISCGAKIRVISPQFSPMLLNLAEDQVIDLHRREYRSSDLDGAYLVFAATNVSEVQKSIMVEADIRGILANCADDPNVCSFHVPAKVRRGNFLLTISTGGGSPALAAKLRRELEEEFGAEYKQFVELLAKIRQQVITDGENQQAHKILFKKLLQLNILALIRKEEWSALQEELGAILPAEMDVVDLIESIQFPGEASCATAITLEEQTINTTKE